MFNTRLADAPQFKSTALSLTLLATAVLSASVAFGVECAWAQGSDVDRPYLDSPATPAPRAAKARRNDAYQPTEQGSSLGVLTSPTDRGPPDRGTAGATVAQAPANDGYTPRYGEPVRPYESYERVPLQPVPAPNTYPSSPGQRSDSYRQSPGGYAQPSPDAYPPAPGGYANDQRGPYREGPVVANQGYGQPYGAPDASREGDRGYDDRSYRDERDYRDRPRDYDRGGRSDGTYSSNEVLSAGHGFFGSMSKGLGSIVENAFKNQGRPNGYILGEEGGGAFVAGLRYGEGTLYTRDAGTHRVYWQGPSVGYDFGGAGSKVMMLVYNMRSPDEIFERFGGVDGSAYLVGGLGMTVLTRNHITVAPIRTGVGLRLGANVGYLKFTPRPTWNPF